MKLDNRRGFWQSNLKKSCYNEPEALMNFEQIRQFSPQMIKIAQKHGISKIYVFGSVARGEDTPQSDVDLLVEMQEGASLFGVAGFCYEVEKILGIHLDVVPRSILPQVSDQEFVTNIQREAVTL